MQLDIFDKPPPTVDRERGKRLRDEGISRVLTPEENWRAKYSIVVGGWFDRLAHASLFTGEELRNVAELMIGEPHHPNAWSGAASSAIRMWLKDGRIVLHGYALAKRASRHANAMREYRKL